MNRLHITLSSLFLILVLCNCTKEASTSNSCSSINTNLSYLALGDSYTIGEGVTEAETWPFQLKSTLEENDFNLENMLVIAQTGWTTTDLLDQLSTEYIAEDGYDLVSLLIGVNNQFQGLSFEEFQSEFNQLVDSALGYSVTDKVFVVSIPDYGVTPFGSSNSQQIALELDEYNGYMALQCETRNLPFINITEISRELGSSEGALAPDNLHPSGSQYEQWVQQIISELGLSYFRE